MAEEKSLVSEEDKKAIEQDIADAKSKLVSKEVQAQVDKVKADTRAEVEKEAALKAQLEKQAAEIAQLKADKERQEKDAAERLNKIQAKVDEMVSSKAPVNMQDPFRAPSGAGSVVDTWNDDKVDSIEEESARKFFGESYDDRA